jgi:hypothetical protein
VRIPAQGEKVVQVGRRRIMRVIFGQPTTS